MEIQKQIQETWKGRMTMFEAQRRRQTTSANRERLKRPMSFELGEALSPQSSTRGFWQLSQQVTEEAKKTLQDLQTRGECWNKHISKVHITFAIKKKKKRFWKTAVQAQRSSTRLNNNNPGKEINHHHEFTPLHSQIELLVNLRLPLLHF